jgi:hypothetical protein
MKQLSVILCAMSCLLLSNCGSGSAEIEAKDAKKYVGFVKSVKGVVADVKISEGHYKNPNYINFGKPYPNQDLTVVVYGDFKKKFSKELSSLKGRNVRIKGKIMWYKQNLQIRNPLDIEIIPD